MGERERKLWKEEGKKRGLELEGILNLLLLIICGSAGFQELSFLFPSSSIVIPQWPTFLLEGKLTLKAVAELYFT